MNQLTSIQINALQLAVAAVLDAISKSGKEGVPAGVLYTALANYKCSFNQFTGLMRSMIQSNFIELKHDCYLIQPSGKLTLEALIPILEKAHSQKV